MFTYLATKFSPKSYINQKRYIYFALTSHIIFWFRSFCKKKKKKTQYKVKLYKIITYALVQCNHYPTITWFLLDPTRKRQANQYGFRASAFKVHRCQQQMIWTGHSNKSQALFKQRQMITTDRESIINFITSSRQLTLTSLDPSNLEASCTLPKNNNNNFLRI